MALSLTVLQPAWMAHARCREADPALFYPRFADQSFYAKRNYQAAHPMLAQPRIDEVGE